MSIDTNFFIRSGRVPCATTPSGTSCTRRACPSSPTCTRFRDDDTVLRGCSNCCTKCSSSSRKSADYRRYRCNRRPEHRSELTALYVAAAYFRDKGQKHRGREGKLVPDSAHGTNPASAATRGVRGLTIKSGTDGLVDLNDLKSKLGDDTAVFAITNPNTLGLFETQIKTITDLLHSKGALVYLDGANMNAILGITRPGDFGADMQHYNVHKTFTGPHGGGGPGSGPIAVRDFLAPYLPAPVVVKDGSRFRLNFDMPKSIGRVRSFFGNVGILFRGYCYIRTLGPDGLKQVSEQAVLNANYLRKRISEGFEVPHPGPCMHEFVASGRALLRERKIRAIDLCKRLLDFGFHAPTVYFPMVVAGAGYDDGADRNREQADARRVRRCAPRDQAGRSGNAQDRTAHARREPAGRGEGRERTETARWTGEK